jgi:hypothetical protein
MMGKSRKENSGESIVNALITCTSSRLDMHGGIEGEELVGRGCGVLVVAKWW